jgi:hypothetical protein
MRKLDRMRAKMEAAGVMAQDDDPEHLLEALISAWEELHRERRASRGAAMIGDERLRQVYEEGWTPEHDDQHTHGEMASAAAAYALAAARRLPVVTTSGTGGDNGGRGDLVVMRQAVPPFWPWEAESYKPGDHLRDLVKAGALIAAEIDRLHRAASTAPSTSRNGETGV